MVFNIEVDYLKNTLIKDVDYLIERLNFNIQNGATRVTFKTLKIVLILFSFTTISPLKNHPSQSHFQYQKRLRHKLYILEIRRISVLSYVYLHLE